MPSLLLCPRNSQWKPPATESAADSLRRSGLLSGPLPAGFPDGFYAGERLLKLIMFLGCSPRVDLVPSSDNPAACYVRLLSFRQPVFLRSDKLSAPRCRVCRQPVDAGAGDNCDAMATCDGCGKHACIAELDWRRSALCACFAVEVRGIHPHEAVPSDELLDLLEKISACPWEYAYIQGRPG
jgi:hypothetical protein